LAANGIKFGEMMQNNGHYAVQGHSRSLVLVPMKKLYPGMRLPMCK